MRKKKKLSHFQRDVYDIMIQQAIDLSEEHEKNIRDYVV
jgi:hypothetical protein